MVYGPPLQITTADHAASWFDRLKEEREIGYRCVDIIIGYLVKCHRETVAAKLRLPVATYGNHAVPTLARQFGTATIFGIYCRQ